MALSIDDSETEHLARNLARLTGETIAMATKRAIEERLCRVGIQARRAALLDDLADIRRRWGELQLLDDRPADEIVGYDEHGLPR